MAGASTRRRTRLRRGRGGERGGRRRVRAQIVFLGSLGEQTASANSTKATTSFDTSPWVYKESEVREMRRQLYVACSRPHALLHLTFVFSKPYRQPEARSLSSGHVLSALQALRAGGDVCDAEAAGAARTLDELA